MQIKTALTAVLLMVSGATAIATDAYHACNCPNNCSHRSGSSCKFRGGPSGNAPVLKGKCEIVGGYLSCIAQ
ncbi:hypothetical protein E4U59_003472 [Claviceps monticola]|nr:hypothetical protein E4U59_003461 [Claviceps monticola]KAG5948141.1 hypothetical protein E4U59_003472 [Claviceps monticola]